MQSRFKPFAIGFAAWVVLTLMGFGPSARADLEILASTNSSMSGATTLAHGNPTSGSYSGTFDGVSMSYLSGVVLNQGPIIAELQGGTISFSNTSGSTQTFYVTISANNFTGPSTPPQILLTSSLGGSGTGTATVSLVSYVEQSNTVNQFGGSLNAGTQTGSPLSFNQTGTAGISTLSSNFAITQYFAVTMNAGATLNFVTTTTLASVPEPSSMAIAGLGRWA